MIDWTGVMLAVGGLLYSILAAIVTVLWSENKNNRKDIAALSVKLAREYHDAEQVRQTITDLINPLFRELSDIKSLLQSLQSSNFHDRNIRKS